MESGGDSQLVAANLVGRVAVGGDAVRADDLVVHERASLACIYTRLIL